VGRGLFLCLRCAVEAELCAFSLGAASFVCGERNASVFFLLMFVPLFAPIKINSRGALLERFGGKQMREGVSDYYPGGLSLVERLFLFFLLPC